MNKETINAEVENIRAILNQHPGGKPNEIARQKIRYHADVIVNAAGRDQASERDGYIIEKAHDIQMNIDRYYSARKHLQYRRDYMSGVDVLRSEIDSLLGRIESWHGWKGRPHLPDES